MSLSESASSIPTMSRCEDASTEAITSGLNAGGVSTSTKSNRERRISKTSRRKDVVIAAA